MATGAKAVKRYAADTGRSFSLVDSCSERLQPAKLWPMGPPGGGRDTPHVESHHLVSLMIGTECAKPITQSVPFVRAFNALVLSDVKIMRRQVMPDGAVLTWSGRPTERGHGRILSALQRGGRTLIGQLSFLVRYLQTPENEWLRDHFRKSGFELRLAIEPAFAATLSLPGGGLADDGYETTEIASFVTAQKARRAAASLPDVSRVISSLDRSIRFDWFDILIDLWGDTVAHEAKSAEASAKASALQADTSTHDVSDSPNGSDPTACVCASANAHSHSKKRMARWQPPRFSG